MPSSPVVTSYAVCVPNFGTYSDPAAVIRLAVQTESSGWDGFFLWDHLAFVWGPRTADPWTLLAAVATRTSTIRIGTAVAVLPRRRPHVVALTAVTLDHLSGGRMIMGVGIGGTHDEYTPFGEEADARRRADRLDESLEVIAALWSGRRVTHPGSTSRVDGVALSPLPVQHPRIPIWVGGNGPPSLRRAARWDGWIADSAARDGMRLSPDELAARVAIVASMRGTLDGFDVAAMGYSTPEGAALPQNYVAAGATWWVEVFHDERGSLEQAVARVAAGPPA